MILQKSIAVVGMVVVLFLLDGCGSDEKEVAEFNKPALYWYQKISQEIARGNMDKADAYFISLKSEHSHSLLLPTAMMMLSHAHMNDEAYLLASYYLDEYNKRYGEEKSREYTDFMKLKSSFLGIQDVYKDQKLILDSIEASKLYITRYPGSSYTPLVNTLLIRLQMSQYLLNENIAALYERTNKPEGAKIYRAKNRGSVVEMADITPPEKGIVGYVFD